MYIVAIITYAFNLMTGQLIIDWIYDVLQMPLLGLSQKSIVYYYGCFRLSCFGFWYSWWQCYMAPIMEGVLSCSLANLEAYQLGKDIPTDKCFIWSFLSGMQH